MPVIKPTNFARATLASPPSGTGGLTFTVAAGKGALFPSPASGEYFYGVFTNAARSAYEIVKIEARSTDAFTIAAGGRGQDGTSAQTWNTGDVFYLPTTRAMWEETSFSAASMAVASLTPAANRIPYFTSATAAALLELGVDIGFPAGTRLIFPQATAPTGWTKVTDAALNDAALRIVTGTGGTTGGNDAFSTHFGTSKSTAGHTLTQAETPLKSHTHGITDPGHGHSINDPGHSHYMDLGRGHWQSNANTSTPEGVWQDRLTGSSTTGITIIANTTGVSVQSASDTSATSHSHTLNNFDIKYVDAIVASKD